MITNVEKKIETFQTISASKGWNVWKSKNFENLENLKAWNYAQKHKIVITWQIVKQQEQQENTKM